MAKKDAAVEYRRCSCGTKATMRTVFNRDGIVFHCSGLCRVRWLKMVAKNISIINSTDTRANGFI
jgi:predicted nucleic acid-binding Zn ribbon protein